jgi:high-affinity nickel-transport protein
MCWHFIHFQWLNVEFMKKEILSDSLKYYLACLGLHIIGIGLLLNAMASYPRFLALGLLAYSLGLRHAFDADHIAAIDNTVRKLISENKKTSGVGFFFSLGHSTVVFLMALFIGLSVKWATIQLPILQKIGGKIGAVVSGSFLIAIAAFNFVILISLFRSLLDLKSGKLDDTKINSLLVPNGFLTRLLRPLFKCINHSWHMYPIGFLFGLGFDTASEIALLALSATATQANSSFLGTLSLPILFAAGMNLMDTTDSVMMSGAYKWAFETPVRKIYYNLTVTAISSIAALLIGSIELLQVASKSIKFKNIFLRYLQRLDFGVLGYCIVILLGACWLVTYLSYKLKNQHFDNQKL